jgi:transposase-like protein
MLFWEATMAGQGYPAQSRRRVLDLIASGRKVADVAADLGISEQTIYSWQRQDRIDRDLRPVSPRVSEPS